jgi:hypothetical protein
MTIHLVSSIDDVLKLALTDRVAATSASPELQTTH